MELKHILGRTWAVEGATALLPVYFLTDRDIVLIDTGYAKLDRPGLTRLIDDNGLRLRGVCAPFSAPTPTSTTPATSAISSSATAAPPPSSSSRPASP